MAYGKSEGAAPMKDLASAIEEAPAEVEAEPDEDDVDAEQAAILEEGGFTPEQGKALIRLINTML